MSAPTLFSASHLGSNDGFEEYQIDRTIVWIKAPYSPQRDALIYKGMTMFPCVWNSLPDVIAAAERSLRADIPEFWAQHDQIGTSNQQLIVYGIWIHPEEGFSEYEVNANYDFDPSAHGNMPAFPDRMCVMVKRDMNGLITESNVIRW